MKCSFAGNSFDYSVSGICPGSSLAYIHPHLFVYGNNLISPVDYSKGDALNCVLHGQFLYNLVFLSILFLNIENCIDLAMLFRQTCVVLFSQPANTLCICVSLDCYWKRHENVVLHNWFHHAKISEQSQTLDLDIVGGHPPILADFHLHSKWV